MNNLHPFRILTGYEPGFCAFKLLVPYVTTISHRFLMNNLHTFRIPT